MRFVLAALIMLAALPAHAKRSEQKAFCKERNCLVLPNGNIVAKCHFGEMEYRWRDRNNGRLVRYTCKP